MKITVTIDASGQSECVCLQWQMPPHTDPSSLYILPQELTPVGYPHAVKDLSRVAVFYGSHFVHFHAPDHPRLLGAAELRCQVAADVVDCNTNRLLEILRTLYAKRVPRAVIDTARLQVRSHRPATLTVSQLAAHPNLREGQRLGQTLKYFWHLLREGHQRTFQNLMTDLSLLVNQARVYANGNEFYFDGRGDGGCGYNGGLLAYQHDHSYGIHT